MTMKESFMKKSLAIFFQEELAKVFQEAHLSDTKHMSLAVLALSI